MNTIGIMTMPADFPYKDVFLRGKPQHGKYDTFRIRHPEMDIGRRAKIFAPFDALRGFGEAVASKNTLYRERQELTESEKNELDRRLHILKELTYNRKTARANMVEICVTCYIPCTDENSEFLGIRGYYSMYCGICWNVDEVCGTILVDGERICFEDILRIENADGIFQKHCEFDGSES